MSTEDARTSARRQFGRHSDDDREEQFLKVIAWDLRDSGGRKDVDWTITVKEGEGALEEILRDKVEVPEMLLNIAEIMT